MINRLLFLFVVLSLVTTRLNAQVNLQTGSATFSLPMFSWKDDKSRLNSLVALSYNSGSGLKVGEVASSVGQGWNLVAGGVITRMQVGEPDDQYPLDSGSNNTRNYPAGYLYASVPAGAGCPEDLVKYPIYEEKNHVYVPHVSTAADRQLDYFTFQFNGKTGMFVLDGATNTGVSLGDSRLKISFQRGEMPNIRTRITAFQIQDIDGLIYKFAKPGKTRVLRSGYCNGDLQELIQPKFENEGIYHQTSFVDNDFDRPWIVGSWYLTEVEDPLTHRKVLLNYDVISNIDAIAGEDITYNSDRNYVVISHKRSVSLTPELTSIVYPDDHRVQLNYGAAREDLKGENVLASVDVTYKGRYLSRHKLNTTYMILRRYGTPMTDYEKRVARLCLRSVKKVGVDLKEDTPPYTFDYFMGGSDNPDNIVPPPFFYAKDPWGFYNGANSKPYDNNPAQSIPFDRTVWDLSYNQLIGLCFLNSSVNGIYMSPKPGYAQNGLLRQIVYPTGGSLRYEYEQNYGAFDTYNGAVGGVHVAQTKSSDGGYRNDCDHPIVTSYQFVLNGGSQSSLWGLERPVNGMTYKSYYRPEYKDWHWTMKNFSLFGECYFHYIYPGILSQLDAIGLTDTQRTMQSISAVLNILNIVSTALDIINICLDATPAAIVAIVIDIIVGFVTLGISCLHDYSREETTHIYYNSDLNGVSPLPAQFRRVEVMEDSGRMGKTIYEFSSEANYTLWTGPNQNPSFSAKQRYAPWAYGLPLKTIVRDSLDRTVKEVENFYNFNLFNGCGHGVCWYRAKYPLSLLSCKCQVKQTHSQRNTSWENPDIYNANYVTTSGPDMDVDIYDLYTGRVELDSTIERNYQASDNSRLVKVKTEYQYHGQNYQVTSVKTTTSTGTEIKSIKYPEDYNSGILATLVQNNILSIPVSVVTSSSAGILSESVTEFAQQTTGDIKPYRTLEQRLQQPFVEGMQYNPGTGGYDFVQFPYYAGPGNSTNSPDYKQVQLFMYNSNGLLTGMKDEGGRTVSNIYDYDDKYIVASVINADANTSRSLYTSFETDNLGGWLAGGSPAFIPNQSVTGARSFSLSAENILMAYGLNGSTTYRLSYWGTNAINAGGSTLVTSSPMINGFTYYEYDVPVGTTQLQLSGQAIIDELRLYPKSARMRTVTYDPLIGKTSESDENNRITYYDYDNLGRLQFIKDEKRNVVKMYEYNNVSTAKQSGCPVIYYNRYTEERIRKSDCGSGYMGTESLYVVPANKYTSTISQEDADAKVANELQTQGQNTANAQGQCQLLYYNDERTGDFYTQGCGLGEKGAYIPYTVLANKYSSLVSKEEANNKADKEIAANGLAHANSTAYRSCVIDTDPEWTWPEGAPTYCATVNGQLPAHLFVYALDRNPNSYSYGQRQWQDAGVSTSCPANTYFSFDNSGYYYSQNCSYGQTPIPYFVDVPPSMFSSTVSQDDANNQAIQYTQNLANQNGGCESSGVTLTCSTGSTGEWNIKMTNVMTGEVSTFSTWGGGSQILGQVPAGTYNIRIYKSFNDWSWYSFEAGCGYYASGSEGNFDWVDINSTCSNISIY